jgi:hypothetical protein
VVRSVRSSGITASREPAGLVWVDAAGRAGRAFFPWNGKERVWRLEQFLQEVLSMISAEDLQLLRDLRDEMDQRIARAQSPYMEKVFIDIKAIVVKRIMRAELNAERLLLAAQRKANKARRREVRQQGTVAAGEGMDPLS